MSSRKGFKPNRGGGKYNKPHGSGNRSKHSRGGGANGGGMRRKFDEYDFNDDDEPSLSSNQSPYAANYCQAYDDYDDFVVESKPAHFNNTQPKRGHKGHLNKTSNRSHGMVNSRQSLGMDRSAGPRRGHGRKRVEMQHLHMSAENQKLVRDMLHTLHQGADPTTQRLQDEEALEELEWRAEDQYWMPAPQLSIQEAIQHEDHVDEVYMMDSDKADESSQKDIDQVHIRRAVFKLTRYGFFNRRCETAVKKCRGDIGQALEFLLCTMFELPFTITCDEDDQEIDMNYLDESKEVDDRESDDKQDGKEFWQEIFQQRTEEITVLKSIYEDRFEEKIPNRIWIVSLELPHVTKYFLNQVQSGKDSKYSTFGQSDPNAPVCQFYKRGNCRYGRRCRYKHEAPNESGLIQEHLLDDKLYYKVEIRFNKGNKYPHQAPLVAFSSGNENMPKYLCLSFTKKMYDLAFEMAEDSIPSVYTMISLLEDENIISELPDLLPLPLSLPEPVTNRHSEEAKQEESRISPDRCLHVTTKQESFNDVLDEVGSSQPDIAYQKALEKDEVTADTEDKEEDYRQKYGRKEETTKKLEPWQITKIDCKIRSLFRKKEESTSYQAMQVSRHKLPAWSKREEILTAVNQSQVIVISGMTGCGKTTQIPQFVLDDSILNGTSMIANIVCTQPRRISAVAVAQRVADERDERLGNSIGYQIRLENVMSSNTRLLFCTTGILLRRLESDEGLEGVSHIILDEVHERTQDNDFLLMVLLDLLKKRKDLKLILMSATLNAKMFSDYFNGCPTIEIPGKTFPVTKYHLEDAIELTRFIMDEHSPYALTSKLNSTASSSGKRSKLNEEDIDEQLKYLSILGHDDQNLARDNVQDQNLTVKQMFARYDTYQKTTIKTLSMMDYNKINNDLIESLLEFIILGEHRFPKEGAILIFLPGIQEITSMYEQLLHSKTFGSRNKNKYLLIPLHSILSSEEQQSVFWKPKQGVRKIVLSTNIAETSITIDDVVFVIDAGKMKEKRYDSTKGMESLDTIWVSKANALQRCGRAGRVMAGVCFHLFTSHRYEYHLREHPIPEIQNASLEQICLRIKTIKSFFGNSIFEILNRLIEPPSQENIQNAISRLEDLGALDNKEQLTPLGYHLSSIPVDVRLGKLMLFGAIFRCLDSTLTIAATLSFKSPFVSPFDKRDDADKKKLEFATGNSDHLTMLKSYQGWLKASKDGKQASYRFCQENFLSIKTMQMLASIKRQFAELLSDIGFIHERVDVKRLEWLSNKRGGDGILESTGEQANSNSRNMKLLAAILVAALYPNVVQVMRPETKFQAVGGGAVPRQPKPEELRFVTKSDGNVFIHPSSVNFQVRYYESPYLVYHEKVKTTKVYIRDCTMVSVYPLLLLAGGDISIDISKGSFIVSLDDGWIRFIAASYEIAQLVKEVRLELDRLLQDKIEDPNMNLATCPRGSAIIKTIVQLITTQ